MIIHSQLFDHKTQRSLADYTIDFQNNSSIDYDDLGNQTEEVFRRNTSMNLSFAQLLHKSNDQVIAYYGQLIEQNYNTYVLISVV